MDYRSFRLLSFDTYGTLIDWESGISSGLKFITDRVEGLSKDAVLEAFGEVEFEIETESPTMLYRDVLAEAALSLGQRWGVPVTSDEARQFARSIRDWPAFPDAPAALSDLAESFRMVTVTNCDRISYMGSNARLEFEWDAIYTAQDIGSYKPSQRNFDYLIERARCDFGVLPNEILHVAQSLVHDMVPATRAGLSKVWINRRHAQGGSGATVPPDEPYTLEAEFPSMADFAAAVRGNRG